MRAGNLPRPAVATASPAASNPRSAPRLYVGLPGYQEHIDNRQPAGELEPRYPGRARSGGPATAQGRASSKYIAATLALLKVELSRSQGPMVDGPNLKSSRC